MGETSYRQPTPGAEVAAGGRLLRDKLTCLGQVCDAAHVAPDIRALARTRMAEGDAKFGDAYVSEDLPEMEREELADFFCYRALRLLRLALADFGCMNWRRRLGLRMIALGERWAR